PPLLLHHADAGPLRAGHSRAGGKGAAFDGGHHDRPAGGLVRRRVRRRSGDGPRAGRHHVGAILDAFVHELLRVPVRHGDFRRARAGQAGAGRRVGRGGGVSRIPEGGRVGLSAQYPEEGGRRRGGGGGGGGRGGGGVRGRRGVRGRGAPGAARGGGGGGGAAGGGGGGRWGVGGGGGARLGGLGVRDAGKWAARGRRSRNGR